MLNFIRDAVADVMNLLEDTGPPRIKNTKRTITNSNFITQPKRIQQSHYIQYGWHGTTAQIAWNIYNTGKVIAGTDNSFWIAEKRSQAKEYALKKGRGTGLVVQFHINPGVRLIPKNGYLTVPIAQHRLQGSYKLKGIEPIRLHDQRDNIIAQKTWVQ